MEKEATEQGMRGQSQQKTSSLGAGGCPKQGGAVPCFTLTCLLLEPLHSHCPPDTPKCLPGPQAGVASLARHHTCPGRAEPASWAWTLELDSAWAPMMKLVPWPAGQQAPAEICISQLGSRMTPRKHRNRARTEVLCRSSRLQVSGHPQDSRRWCVT